MLLTDDSIETIVHCIVESKLEYRISLFLGIDQGVINKLQRLQNAAARIVCKRKKREFVRDVLVDLQ